MMSENEIIKNCEAIASIDARGFIFGSSIAFYAGKPMVVFRKPGKLPGELKTANYELEYGKNSLSIQKTSIQNFSSFAIVDDLLATGGTVNCVANLLKKKNKKITGLLTVVELNELKGRLGFDFPVKSFISF